MNRLRKLLPPPNSLVAFEAAARLSSFSAAAEEIGVTPGAISRQVRILEDWVQVPLFERAHRSVRLTGAGQRLLQAVAMGLDHISAASQELKRSTALSDITVLSTFAATALWLRSRAGRYAQIRPSVDIRLVASDLEIDFEQDGYDVAIRYGSGVWDGYESELVIEEAIFPVCSPDYLKANKPLSLADLVRHRLLHVERRGLTWVDWPVWLREMDVGVPGRLRGPIFNNYVIMIEAAIDGQGIGLGWHGLLDDFLASGQLVKPVQGELRTGRGYYLVRRQSARRNEIVDSFCQWIVESAKPT
jgi:LysR family glycine cleavage system transcriptional activator